MELIQLLSDLGNTYIVNLGIPVGEETISFMVLLLLGTGVFLTLRLGFIQYSQNGTGRSNLETVKWRFLFFWRHADSPESSYCFTRHVACGFACIGSSAGFRVLRSSFISVVPEQND